MTSRSRYFVFGYVAQTLHTRYAVLIGDTVRSLQISRPEGVEIDRPASVKWKLDVVRPGERKTYTFHNGTSKQQEAEARQRAHAKSARTHAWQRAAKEAA